MKSKFYNFCNFTDKESLKELTKKIDANTSLLVNWNMHLTNSKKITEVGEKIRQIYTAGTFQDNLGLALRVIFKMTQNIYFLKKIREAVTGLAHRCET